MTEEIDGVTGAEFQELLQNTAKGLATREGIEGIQTKLNTMVSDLNTVVSDFKKSGVTGLSAQVRGVTAHVEGLKEMIETRFPQPSPS